MKKITLSLIMLLVATFSYSQTDVIDENFNGATIPAGWGTLINSGSHDWTFGSGEMPGGPDFTTNGAIFDDDAAGNTGDNNVATLYYGPIDASMFDVLQLYYEYSLQVIGATGGQLTVALTDLTNSISIPISVYNTDIDYSSTTIDLIPIFNANPGFNTSDFYIDFIYDDVDSGWNWGAGINYVGLTGDYFPSANNDFANAEMLTINATCVNTLGTILGATASGETPFATCGSTDGTEPDVWYSFIAPADGNVTITTSVGTGDDLDTVMQLYSYSGGTLTTVECNDDSIGTFSSIDITDGSLIGGDTYYVQIHEYNGDFEADFNICVVGEILSINENTIAGFNYYPNPATNVLNLKAFNNIDTVEVYNILGQKVISQSFGSTNIQLNVSNLSTGIYVMKVSANGETSSIRVVKQ